MTEIQTIEGGQKDALLKKSIGMGKLKLTANNKTIQGGFGNNLAFKYQYKLAFHIFTFTQENCFIYPYPISMGFT